MKNIVLGISAWYHDSAAVIVKNGKIIAAAQEERFTRKKFDESFPHNAINFCLSKCNITIDDVDKIVFYENSYKKFERILMNFHLTAPKSFFYFTKVMPEWLNKKLWIEKTVQNELGVKKKIDFFDHHICHAASAFLPSPYQKAAIITIDGVGEWTSLSYGVGEGKNITLMKEMRYPNSIGLLYSAFTYYCGFRINSGEYKLMGLAPYGKPRYVDLIKREILHICDDGSIVMNQKYFDYTFSLHTINAKFEKLFGRPARKQDSELDEFTADIAASIQAVTEEIVVKLANYVYKETGCTNLVLAGGVALNVKANSKILKETPFKNIWVQPAAGDAGGALGAALYMSCKTAPRRNTRDFDAMSYAFLGYEISDSSAEDDKALREFGGVWKSFKDSELHEKVAQLLAEGYIVGVARGNAEFGPRALGNRSILADARDETMQSRLNLKIKYRESFRPFAPIVMEEDAGEYFEKAEKSPYMTMCFDVKEKHRLKFDGDCKDIFKTVNIKKSVIPAVTHIDYSARVQTVSKESNEFIYGILKNFRGLTNCSVLVNTSFNVRGEPIVNNAVDAYRCFMKTDMDFVVIGNRLFDKKEQRGVDS